METMNHSLTPAKARKARVSVGLTQKQVADDLRNLSGNIIKITNTKLSRYEKGDITLDEGTLVQLEKYLNEKTAYFNDQDEPEGELKEKTSPTENQDIKNQDKNVSDQDKNLDLSSILYFDLNMNDYMRQALQDRFFSLTEQLDDLISKEVKRGFFGGVSEESESDAKAIVYTMAGLYNIVRALQGNPVLPIQDDEESILGEEDILSLVQKDWFHFTDQGPVASEEE